MQDAMKFLYKLKENSDTRKVLYTCNSHSEVEEKAREMGYVFTHQEIEDAYRSILLKCQNRDEAEVINDVFNSYLIVTGENPVFLSV
ncbi:MAG: Nif11 family protein [Bacteroidales bacterium]|nr:Nif11 family protein [Bacteroidales bacterium]